MGYVHVRVELVLAESVPAVEEVDGEEEGEDEEGDEGEDGG